MRMVCLNCDGDGYRQVPRMAVVSGTVRTVVTSVRCAYCDDGWRPFEAPVPPPLGPESAADGR